MLELDIPSINQRFREIDLVIDSLPQSAKTYLLRVQNAERKLDLFEHLFDIGELPSTDAMHQFGIEWLQYSSGYSDRGRELELCLRAFSLVTRVLLEQYRLSAYIEMDAECSPGTVVSKFQRSFHKDVRRKALIEAKNVLEVSEMIGVPSVIFDANLFMCEVESALESKLEGAAKYFFEACRIAEGMGALSLEQMNRLNMRMLELSTFIDIEAKESGAQLSHVYNRLVASGLKCEGKEGDEAEFYSRNWYVEPLEFIEGAMERHLEIQSLDSA